MSELCSLWQFTSCPAMKWKSVFCSFTMSELCSSWTAMNWKSVYCVLPSQCSQCLSMFIVNSYELEKCVLFVHSVWAMFIVTTMNWKSVYCVFTMSECVHREQLWAGNLCTICSQCLRVFIGGHNCYTMSNCQLVIDVLFVHISRALWISKSHFILLQEYVLCTTKLLPLQKLSKPQSTTPSSPSSRPRAHPPPTPPRPPSPHHPAHTYTYAYTLPPPFPHRRQYRLL